MPFAPARSCLQPRVAARPGSVGLGQPLALLVLGLWAGLAGTVAQAADAPTASASKVDLVTVYPGLAVVERSARVAAGARELLLDCLSTEVDLSTLQLDADASLRLGPVSASQRPRSEVPACQTGAGDARIRQLQDRVAALDAEAGGHELVLGYLRAMAGPVVTPVEGGAPIAPATARAPGLNVASGAQLQATLGVMQRSGQGALAEQARIAREREVLERELQALLAERERLGQAAGEVRQLRISVMSASAEGTVRLRYQVPGPTWAPSYRATLDSASGMVDVERLAEVSQRSGEDWRGVALRLSTGSPRAASSGPQPRPWAVMPRPAVQPMARAAVAMAAAPPPLAMAKSADAALPEEPPLAFAVQAVEGEFATEFEVPGRIDVGSGAQRVSFPLGRHKLAAKLLVQTTPQADASAWVVAELARPEGVWPEGRLQLLRGTQVVGQSVWSNGSDATERLTLPFGRDELVRVRVVKPGAAQTGSAGFIGNRSERRITRSYEVENRHRAPISLQVLEASPVSTDDKITVQRSFTPATDDGEWQDQAGVVVWTRTVAAGDKARFSAEYVISAPKELAVIDRR